MALKGLADQIRRPGRNHTMHSHQEPKSLMRPLALDSQCLFRRLAPCLNSLQFLNHTPAIVGIERAHRLFQGRDANRFARAAYHRVNQQPVPPGFVPKPNRIHITTNGAVVSPSISASLPSAASASARRFMMDTCGRCLAMKSGAYSIGTRHSRPSPVRMTSNAGAFET